MWQLLKADLMYNKFILIISYILAVPFLVFSWEGEGSILEKAHFILISMFVLAILVIIIKNSTYSQEKRTRLFAELPIPAWQAGISRLLFLIIFWIGVVILLWITKWILQPGDTTGDPVIFWGMLYATGAIVIINGLYLMLGDLKYCFGLRPRHLNHKMTHMDFLQILVCGMVTGLVICYLGFFLSVLNNYLLQKSWDFSAALPPLPLTVFFGHIFLILVFGAATMFIYRAVIPTFGDGLKNILITTLIVWILGVIYVISGTLLNISIKVIIDLTVLLPQSFLGILAGASMYRKGHTGLVPKIMVIIGCFLCVIFTWKIFTFMKSGPVNPYFSMTLLNPAIVLNVVGLGISYLGVLTYLSRRSYVK